VQWLRRATAILLILAGFVHGGRAQEKPWERAGNLSAGKNPVPEEARIDINHASVEELLKVPGMTRSWAGRIVRYRPYRTKLDLLDRGVVTAEVYARIKDGIIAHRVKAAAVRLPQ
jgi:DNA uptake protein ComE-like DNA-binding protein